MDGGTTVLHSSLLSASIVFGNAGNAANTSIYCQVEANISSGLANTCESVASSLSAPCAVIVAAYVYHCTKDQGKRFQVVRLDATPTRQRWLGPPASHGVSHGVALWWIWLEALAVFTKLEPKQHPKFPKIALMKGIEGQLLSLILVDSFVLNQRSATLSLLNPKKSRQLEPVASL